MLAIAGLWDRWRNPDTADELLSCTMIVGGANEWMTAYHDRMPILLHGQEIEAWLDGSMGADGLRPAAEDILREWPVSKRVNRTGEGDDDPMLLDPITPTLPL